LSEPPRSAADHCDGQWRLLQSKTFDGLSDPCGYRSPFAAMIPLFSCQRSQPESLILCDPTLRGSERNPRFDRHRAQWPILLEMRLQQPKPIQS
jgi:hypothetical protein